MYENLIATVSYVKSLFIGINNKGNVYCSSACYGVCCRVEIPCVVCGKPILSGLHRKTSCRSCSNIHRTGIIYKQGRRKSKVDSQSVSQSEKLKD